MEEYKDNYDLPAKAPGTALQGQGNTSPAVDRISDLLCRALINRAIKAQKMSYAPYSHWNVGAALLAKNGSIIPGCNIENAGYTPTNCAERTAFFKAVSEGIKDFAAIAVVGGPDYTIKDYCAPCGVCRQVMMEFCDPKNFYIIIAKSEDEYLVYTLEEMLPMGFGPKSLGK